MPSPFEKLQRYIRLESERGYDNRAVVGGLDKIIPWWEPEARTSTVAEETLQAILERLRAYPKAESEDRSRLVGELEILLEPLSKLPRAERPPRPQPAKTAPRPEHLNRPAHPVRSPERPSGNLPAHSSQPTRPPQPRTSPAALPSHEALDQGLRAPVTVLQGIGPSNAKTFSALGMNTLDDLLHYYPRRYDDYSQMKPINRLNPGEVVTILAAVKRIDNRNLHGKREITEAIVEDGTGALRITWFNQPWLANRLPVGTQIVLSGKVEMYLGRLVMNSPEWEYLEQEHLHTNRIVPVYSLTAGVSQKQLRKAIYQVASFWAPRHPDFMPVSIRETGNLIPLSTALVQVHFPDNPEKLAAARERLAFDEIFLLQLGVLSQKRSWQVATAQTFTAPEEWLQSIEAELPFALTGAQKHALGEIHSDLASGHPMERLLQGDVGSGKTIVAALAMASVAREGAQSALMAPTSILADQHYRSLTRLLCADEPTPGKPFKPSEIRLLIGDTSEADRQEILAGLANGEVKFLVGTHALIEDPVSFQRLQLAIVDEQHRFGVAQRAALRNKGENPHLLVMTATPIPRSLALSVYGDLDLSILDEMPAGRMPVETHVLLPLERERAYQLIRTQLKAGRQAFIIYPLVEKGDRDDESKAAVDEHARLQAEVFPHEKIGLLHGRMTPEDKDAVMKQFRDHEIDILVSTSVVEVGVDVPNATVMLIEGANRFGLAQLHQFRGRVGRGDAQSYCLLIPETDESIENERLKAMVETNDGFVLAERDLQQRGPGEFLGTRQAGFSELRMASLTNVRLIEKARQLAQLLFTQDPELSQPQNQALKAEMSHFWGNGRGDIS
ncbi:ATP-dependent DNA helicase RecG [Longilinea arvoryzae]|uniref:ATP-dependent DNA helicase RecG n=1 Tax=Longilinea arvoryzae TaxID=360412 RepID=A0A0S7BHM5_9CHLR|nr:ATP-dependent DNA helicase RecG [Longilinea arvoryzae]GAP14596.1 ATP-dependent DNA helicase RecG [Longilinea arvoryzae]